MKWFWLQFVVIIVAVGVILSAFSLFAYLQRQRNEHRYDAEINEAVQAVPVDAELIRAIIWRETHFNSQMTGFAGERGLMQVTGIAAQDWANAYKVLNVEPENLFDPQVNVNIGTWYIGRALYRWRDRDDPIPFALAEYNAGRSRALKWVDPESPTSAELFMRRIDYPSTFSYIESIMKRYKMYKKEHGRSDLVNWFHHLTDSTEE